MVPRDTENTPDRPARLLLTIGQAAAHAQVSVETMRRWADQGKVPALRTPGGQRRFLADDIEAIYGARESA